MKRILKFKPALAGLIAALYIAFSLVLQPLYFGPLQFRVSEVFAIMPIIFPEGIWGLTLGCFFTNLNSPFGVLDWGLGTVATLIGALLTRYFRRNIKLALLMPVLSNAIIVSLYVSKLTSLPYAITALYIGISEAIVIYLLGWPLLKFIERNPMFSGFKD